MKILWLALLACVACRMLTSRWPWELLTPSAKAQTEARARALLNVTRGASPEDIVEAHRRLIARVHPDRGGSDAAVHEANAARDALLASASPQRRS